MSKQLQKSLPKTMGEELTLRGLTVDGFEPHSRHLVVEPLAPETTFGGKLVVPETHRKKQAAGYVRKISPSDFDSPYQVGDIVLFAPSTGTPVRFGDKDMLIMQWHSIEESDVLGRWPANVVDKAG